jgi:hypothetical protein
MNESSIKLEADLNPKIVIGKEERSLSTDEIFYFSQNLDYISVNSSLSLRYLEPGFG